MQHLSGLVFMLDTTSSKAMMMSAPAPAIERLHLGFMVRRAYHLLKVP